MVDIHVDTIYRDGKTFYLLDAILFITKITKRRFMINFNNIQYRDYWDSALDDWFKESFIKIGDTLYINESLLDFFNEPFRKEMKKFFKTYSPVHFGYISEKDEEEMKAKTRQSKAGKNIRAFVKKISVCDGSLQNRIFFNIEDVCKVVGWSKEYWDKIWKEFKDPKNFYYKYDSYYNENEDEIDEEIKEDWYWADQDFAEHHYIEVIEKDNTFYENLYCTVELLERILDNPEDFFKIKDLFIWWVW